MTLYRVLKGDTNVASDTARRVEASILHLGYVPAHQRKSGEHGRAGAMFEHRRVAFLIPDHDPAAARTALTGQLLHGIEQVLTRRGIELLFTRLTVERDLPPPFQTPTLDGAIIRSGLFDDWPHENLQGLARVWLMEHRKPGPAGDHVHTDDAEVGRLAAQVVKERGHRRVVVVNEDADHLTYLDRVAALEFHLRDHGVRIDTAQSTGKSVARLAVAIDRVLDADRAPAAFFIPGTTPLFTRLHQMLAQRGMDPASSTVITANYDPDLVDTMSPPPLHIDAQPEDLGRAAAETLIWRLQNPDAPARVLKVMPVLRHPAS